MRIWNILALAASMAFAVGTVGCTGDDKTDSAEEADADADSDADSDADAE
ncbi:MAG: hypothetical protein AAGA48_33685 [Myxococcota bacterium]